MPGLNISSLLHNIVGMPKPLLDWPEIRQLAIWDVSEDSLIFSPRELNSEAYRSQADAQLQQTVAVGNEGPVLPDLTFQEKQEIQMFTEFVLIPPDPPIGN